MTERILIAEDDPAIADSVGYSLRACGYHVDVVGSGEAVLESGPGSYDLLILDVMLPGLSGVEACRRVRERSAVPVLMLTALAGEAGRAPSAGPQAWRPRQRHRPLIHRTGPRRAGHCRLAWADRQQGRSVAMTSCITRGHPRLAPRPKAPHSG